MHHPDTKPATGLFVVALGASAGGLEAIHEFFDNLNDAADLCFVIIQHLSSDHKSLLVELVSRHTHMQVTEAAHGQVLAEGHVYVIPNDKLLSLAGGRLQLSAKEQERGPNLAIDHFLLSLAADTGEEAIAVILSGTGSDGTRGAGAVREQGGLVLVQDPAMAKFDGMPLSAVQAGVADEVLPIAAMARSIHRHVNIARVNGAQPPISGNDLSLILNTVHQTTGYDFRQYKPATIMRRISRRIANTRSGSLEQYTQLLQQNREEPRQLAREFFIGVTAFFRDPEAFQVLREQILPGIVGAKEPGAAIKVWVTACSTGQEAYSLAMLISEFLQAAGDSREFKIFATDIDERAIEVAARGRFPKAALDHLPAELRERYFFFQDEEAVIVPNLRKQIVFARHNILKDPPFIKNDLVTCRNLLIYLNGKLQEGVLQTLYFALVQGGYLFLGPSEQPSVITPELEEVNARWKIFRKKGSVARYHQPADATYARRITPPMEVRNPKVAQPSLLAAAFASSLADDFGFAAVYVNEHYEVKEVMGDFRRYLSLPDRIVNLNILRMVPVELSGMLSAAFRRVSREKTKQVFRNTRVHVDGKAHTFQVSVHPPAEGSSLMMVVMGELPAWETRSESSGAPDSYPQNYVQELEEELKETRLNLQMAVEGLETTNEELQSANEELQSANEELQSSNEELQSLNEELHTLNTEHQLRIRELKLLNDDLDNYFRSTEIGQIFLDAHLQIRKFNGAATQMVNVIATDIGRPIANISTNIRYANLLADIGEVTQYGKVVEREIELHNHTICLLRILPYVRHDGRKDGVVITFVDITAIRNLDNTLKGVFDNTSSAILVFDAVRNDRGLPAFRCRTANHAAVELLELKQEVPEGKWLEAEMPRLSNLQLNAKLMAVMETGQPLRTEVSLGSDTGIQWYNLVANQVQDGLIMVFTNITPLKTSEEKLRRNYFELLQTKETLKQLNSQLEEKVTARTGELSRSEERFRLVAGATNDAIWDWDFAGNAIWWGDSFFTLFGYHREDPQVQQAAFWLSHIHPDDRPNVEAGINGVIQRGEHVWTREYRFRRADGSYAVIFDRGTVMHDEWGVPYRMLGAMMDITAASETRRNLEDKNLALEALIREFSFVTDFMPQMVWATRPDGYHEFFNKQWFAYTGLNFDESRNSGWSALLHPDDTERTWQVWQQSLATGAAYEVEYRMRRYDGVYRWFLARALPMRNEEGVIIKWFGTCTDIHDQKQANDLLEQKVTERTRDLQQTNAELEVSNNELMQFASIASHDLKEPLRKIHIFSSLIRDRYYSGSSEPVADYLDRIIRAASRMTGLINDLLDYSRLSADSMFQPTDLHQLVQEVLHDLELPLHEQKACIHVSGLPVLAAIPGQMRQIFQNLISNALKFCRPDTPPVIRITGTIIGAPTLHAAPQADGAFCRITITDNGIGFDEQYAQKIFVIFQRLHARETYEGTGIGLAIAKKIVEKHGGQISATGAEGRGATFTIILPVQQD